MNTRTQTTAAAAVLLAITLIPTLANAQDSGQQELRVKYSLYYEDFKNGNYEGALPNLRWILNNAPAFPRNTDTNFERAVETYTALALAEADSGTRRALLDTALVMLDTAVPTIREVGGEIDEFEWTLKKGTWIFEHLDHMPDHEADIAAEYREAWELNPAEIDPYYLEYILAHLLQNDGDKEATVNFLDELEERRGSDPAIVSLLSKWRGAIFTNPEERYEYLQTELEKEPENIEILNELLSLSKELEYRDDLYEYTNRLIELAPTASLYRNVGSMMLSDEDLEGALEMFNKALELSTEPSDRRDTHYNMGLAEQQMGRLSRARTNFRQALDIDAGFGRALLAIGDLYVTAIANCGSFEREDRAVYWLAADYFARAKAADPSIAAQADNRIRQYRAYYPDREAMFFMKWEVGDSYQVNKGCYSWINETTTVKAP